LPPATTVPPVTNPPPTTPPPAAVFPGTYVVNSQLSPGRYVMENAKNGCYWERKSGFGGTFGEIIANDFRGYTGRVIVDVLASDAGFEFDSPCGTMRAYVPSGALATSISPGTHAVGQHIQPGTYSTNAAANCYWERLRSFDGRFASIIANDFRSAAGQAVVTLSAADVGFTTEAECGTWTKIG
jgi:hypothetical protein